MSVRQRQNVAAYRRRPLLCYPDTMQVVRDFFHSEKGVFAFLIPSLAVTLFAITGKVTYEQWANMLLGLSAIYTGGKAVQGAGAKIAEGKHYKTMAEAAQAELDDLHAMLDANDAEADKALAEKMEGNKE